MNMSMIVVLIILSIFIFMLMGVPIYAGLGAAGVIGLMLMQTRTTAAATTLIAIPQNFYSSIGYFPLLAIPF